MDVINILVPTLLGVWKIRKFCDSRWLSVGSSSKSMVAGRLTGLQCFFKFAAQKPAVSTFFLTGFLRLQDNHWVCLAESALVSAVPDSAQQAVLKDARVALTAHLIKQDMVLALEHLSSLPERVWDIIAGVANVGASALRMNCVRAGHRAIAFLDFRLFQHAQGLPWSLCRGDLVTNLQLLQTAPRPITSAVGGQIWDLLHLGYPVATLTIMVRLLGECSWGTQVVEQIHASAAVVSRFHPEYALDTLLCRSMMLLASKLLPSQTKKQKAVAKLQKQMTRLARQNPSTGGARQFYFGELCKVAATTYGQQRLPAIRKHIMKSHAGAFRAHAGPVQFSYIRRALANASARKQEILEQRTGMLRTLGTLQSEVAAEAVVRKPLLLSTAPWTSWEHDLFANLMSDDDWKGVTVLKLRDRACAAPTPPSAQLVAALDKQQLPELTDALPSPDWLGRVAQHRDWFSDSVFVVSQNGSEKAYAFVFAMQNPVAVWVSPLSAVDWYVDVELFGSTLQWPRHEYQTNCGDNVDAASVLNVPLDLVSVIHGFALHGQGRLVSTAVATPVAGFLAGLPQVRQRGSGGGAAAESSLASEVPWAETLLQKRAFKSRGKAKTAPCELSAEIDEDLSFDGEEFVSSAEVLADLATMPQEWADLPEDGILDFQVSLLGGAWTLAHRGVVADACSAAARGERAVPWCRSRGMPLSARYDLRLYGEEVAAILARGWCSKMQFLLNESFKTAEPTARLTEAARDRWVPPSELARVELDLAGHRRAQQRLSQIRLLC